MCEKFDHLYAMLEDRKTEMSLVVTAEQEEKLDYIRGLKRKYEDHVENVTKIVESGIQIMEEPDMAVFLQVRQGKHTLVHFTSSFSPKWSLAN